MKRHFDSANENGYRFEMRSESCRIEADTESNGDDPAGPIRDGRIASRDLLGERGVVTIVHEGREYRLRVTQNGRLILTA